MPFCRNKLTSGRLLAARFRADKVVQILREEEVKRRRRPPRFRTGIHNGVFYRIAVPSPKPATTITATTLSLPALPKFFTPTSPPKPLTPVPPPASCGVSSSSDVTSLALCATIDTSAHTSNAAASGTATVVTAAATAAASTLVKLSSSARKRTEFWERFWLWLQENYSTLILNFGSICTLIGFTRSDVLELRGLSVTGSVCAIIYNVTSPPLRLTPVLWSSTFAAVNGWKILHILQERKGSVHFTHEQEERYINFFMPHGITPKQFEMIHTQATLLHVNKGDLIVRQNDALQHVYLVVAGSTRASVLGRFVTAASTTPTARSERAGGASGAWIGEMGLLERVWMKEQSSRSGNKNNTTAAITTTTNNGTTSNTKTNVNSAQMVDEMVTIPSSEKELKDRTKNRSVASRPTTADSPIAAQSHTNSIAAGHSKKSSQVNASRAMYTIVAEEDCTVLRWSHDDMQELMERSTDMRAALTRAMTAAIVAKVINFTVSRSSAKATWATWLDDWKYNAGAQVQTLAATTNPSVNATELVPEYKEEEEELPRYPLKRFM